MLSIWTQIKNQTIFCLSKEFSFLYNMKHCLWTLIYTHTCTENRLYLSVKLSQFFMSGFILSGSPGRQAVACLSSQRWWDRTLLITGSSDFIWGALPLDNDGGDSGATPRWCNLERTEMRTGRREAARILKNVLFLLLVLFYLIPSCSHYFTFRLNSIENY